METLLQLFLSFLKVGSFSFGGAYSLLPLIEREVVTNNHWLSKEEFLKVLGMVEIFPGAISIKFATYTGYKTGGILGAVAANLGNLFTPAIMILFTAYFYSLYEKNEFVNKAFSGIKYAIVGMIVAIMYQYAIKSGTDWRAYLMLVVGAALILTFKMHPAFVVLIAAVIGLIIF